MQHIAMASRNYKEDDKGKALSVDASQIAHKFWKMGVVRKNEGGTPGKIVGEYMTARIEVGGGPRQVTVEDLENLLETKQPMMAPPADLRGQGNVPGPVVTIRLGYGNNEWTEDEIKEIISTVKGKKNAGTTGSGNGPTRTRATRSKSDES